MTTATTTGRAKRHAREVELLALVDDLTERFVHDAEVTRDACGRFAGRPWSERHKPWRTREAGLLEQLRVQVAGRRPAVRKPEVGLVGFGEVGPTGLHRWYDLHRTVADAWWLLGPAPCNGLPEGPVLAAVDVLASVHEGARRLRQAMGARGRRGAAGELRAVAGLCRDVDDELLEVALRRVRAWHRAALVVLGYEVPVATLRDFHCPDCGGAMLVLEDASSDVWCAGPAVCDRVTRRETTASAVCGRRWPRAWWTEILEARQRLVTTTELAQVLGITDGHVRLLVSKGILPAPVDSRPTGGQATHLFDGDAAAVAFDAWVGERVSA